MLSGSLPHTVLHLHIASLLCHMPVCHCAVACWSGVLLQEKVDKKLLGGFILEFEDRLVDMSVKKKLEEFNNLVFKLENDLLA